jgi:HTH-type transcriptional regulator/antitoxin HigA
MIKNDFQHKKAKATLKKFLATYNDHARLTADQEPWARDLHRATLGGEIAKLEADINDYEMLKSGKTPSPELGIIGQIGILLIRKRIALGWTQDDLARRLKVKPQQVQADEANNYASANLARIAEIARVLSAGRRKRAG